MGEAACVMHSFTFPSYADTQGKGLEEELQESVSFGRFATEALAWDKWSSFSNKRYVEEAAKHSQPGLVAKKKAFFEAYYKKKALLEQEQENVEVDANCTQEIETETENLNTCYQSLERMASDLQAKDAAKDDMEDIGFEASLLREDSEKPTILIQAATHQEVPEMELFPCTEKNAAILRDMKVKTSEEASDVTIGKILPCPQPPPHFPRALSKKSSLVKGPRVSFARSTEDISPRNSETGTFRELPVLDVPCTEKLPASKMLTDSLDSETKRTTTLLNTTASRSRKGRTDMLLFAESSKAHSESKSPVISSPFVFGTGKGTDEKREKLGEILNSKASKRVQFQTKIKNKAASQLKKLRLSFCFSSSASPDLHWETMKSQAKPAKLEADPSFSNAQKNGCWRQVEKQRSHRKIRPGSLGEVIAQRGKSHIVQCL